MNPIKPLLDFITNCPSAYHVAANILQQLQQAGAVLLEEGEDWQSTLEPCREKGGCFVVKRGAALIAFQLPPASMLSDDLKMHLLATHSDSPTLKVKNEEITIAHQSALLHSEPYGGIMDQSFFDRDLSMAGQVAVKKSDGKIQMQLIDFEKTVAIIPSLALHLQDKEQKINREQHLRPILWLNHQENKDKKIKQLLADQLNCDEKEILSYDLFLYDKQPPALIGLKQDLVASRSLDNLCMTHAGLQGFLAALSAPSTNSRINVLAIFNHEEIGSMSDEGSTSFLLERCLRRLLKHCQTNTQTKNDLADRLFANSLVLSADVAHALHPNYPEAHSQQHQPKMGGGIVLKRHAALRYATQAQGEAKIVDLLTKKNIPYQSYINRSDKPSGATIGSVLASRLGATTIDLGSAVLAMHSMRELMSAQDHLTACQVAKAFFLDEF